MGNPGTEMEVHSWKIKLLLLDFPARHGADYQRVRVVGK